MSEFSELLKEAAGQPPRPLNMAAVRERAARLGVRRRAVLWLGVLLAALGIGVPTGVSLLPSGGQPTDMRTIEDERDVRTVEADRDERTTDTDHGIPESPPSGAPPTSEASDPETRSSTAPQDEPRPAPTVTSTSTSLAATACSPLMTDPEGDIDNPAVDIRESNITFDDTRNQLRFTHRMEDIPSSPLPGEVLVYIFDFDWDGLKYRVQANFVPTGEQYFFARDNRTQNQWPDTASTSMGTTGRIDREADTVTIHVGIDDFNQYERSVAADEGMQPAAELEIGAQLTNTRLRAYPYAAGTAPYDTATGCHYAIG